jgi:hypothetical protein
MFLSKLKTTTALLLAGLLVGGLLTGALSADPSAGPRSAWARPSGATRSLALDAALGAPNLPPAPPEKFTFVDLKPHANQKLKDNFGNGGNGNNLADFGEGGKTLASVNFRIGEGVIRLGSKVLQKGKEKPDKVEGIKVGKKGIKLHILHATEFAGTGQKDAGFFLEDGVKIAEYKVYYDDGNTATIPVVNGEDVRDWWFNDSAKGVTRGQVVWKGDNELAKDYAMRIRLYLTTWENPHPAKAIASIDFIKVGDSTAAPFCVAITLEAK